MDLNNFVSRLKDDNLQLNKPFLFEVTFTLPGQDPGRDMTLLCHQAQVPGWSFNTQPFKVYGLSVERPTDFAYTEASFSFYVDRHLKVIQILEKMKEKVINTTDYSINYADSYFFITSINIYDIDNKVYSAVHNLHNCMIKSLQSINLDWASQNQIQLAQMTIAFEYMTSDFTTGTTVLTPPDVQKLMQAYSTGSSTLPTPVNYDTVRLMDPALASQYTESIPSS